MAWYPFNANTLDESFNGNNGTIQGGVSLTDDRFSSAQSAQMFDGNSLTYINCGNDPMLNITNGESLTVSAWVNYTTVSAQRVILSKNSSSNQNVQGAYTLWLNHGIPKFTISNEGGVPSWYETVTGPDTLAANTWYFLTGIIDFQALEIRLYVNGDLADIQPWGGTIDTAASSDLLIGCHYKSNFAQGYQYNLNGKIDDIGLWERVLDQCEIIDLYTSGMLDAGSQNGSVLTANQTGATYQWLDCDNNYAVINSETNQSYTPAVTGNYAVEVNMNGCVDTSDCFLVDHTGIEELLQKEKELVMILDFMGRETEFKPNTPLIFIYSDGTRERVMKLE